MRHAWGWLLAVSAALALAVGLLLGLGGQNPYRFTDADQVGRGSGPGLTLEPGQPLGQTFVARHGGLAGIEFFLLPTNGAPLTLTLHLRADPHSAHDLTTASRQLPPEAGAGFYRFSFPALALSHGQYYYAFLDSSGPGLSVSLADDAAYLDGAAYQAHQPLDAQTTFRLVYAPADVALDLFKAALGWAGLLAVASLLFVVPGWALLAWFWPGQQLTWAEVLGLAVGVSLALYPLLLLWTDLVGLHLGRWYAWIPAGLGLLALFWRYRHWRPRRAWEGLRQWARSKALWPDLALLIVLALVFGVRLLAVRTLDAPLWGDSYQHTVIAQLLLDHGGLFDSWEPYAPYCSLTVHFGFPAAMALLSWVTGWGSVQSTLLGGQLINSLAILTLYPLAVRLADGKRWAGVGAVLAAGLLSPMPAFYVNWGRYAQLAGQVILPVALWLTWEAVEADRLTGRAVWLAGIVIAGMTLAYYRTPFYLAVFVLAWLLGWGVPHWRGNVRRWLRGIALLATAAATALLLFLPWALQVAGGRLTTSTDSGIGQDVLLRRVLADYRIWRDITSYVPLPLLVAALTALVWSLARRKWTVASVGLWLLGLASLVAGRLVHLPGASQMQNFAIVIALYIPVGLLVGWLFGEAASLVERRAPRAGRWLLSLAVVAAALWSAAGQTRIVQPSYTLVTRPDVRAMAWIRDNTPPEARFLVEGYPIFGGYSAVGADAGWWLPLLAGRENTMPPQYALLNERPADPAYSRGLVDLVEQLTTTPPTSPQGLRLLCEWGISHAYVGQGQGQVGLGAVQLFSPDDLRASPAFSPVYQQDQVHIFALSPQACGDSNP